MQSKLHIVNSITRYINGLYTRKDTENLFHAFKSGYSREEMEKEMEMVWEESKVSGVSIQHEQYKEEARQLLKRIQKKEKRFSLLPFFKYVAVVAAILTVGIGVYQYADHTKRISITYTEVKVSHGEQKRVTLPDGSWVILNSGSYMRYPSDFITDSRLVEMDGEAFFEVEKVADKLFIVRTKDADVKVLGTSFNVKAYDTDELIAVSVRTGKVQVDMSEVTTRLHPNEQLVFDRRNGEFQKRNEDVKRTIAWVNGGLYFNKTPIHSVVRELMRIYNCTIEFAPGNPYEEYIYGEHDNKSLESVLKSIQYSTDLKYRKEGDKFVLYK